MNHTVKILISAVLFFATLASAEPLQKAVLGKWMNVDRTETLELFQDGTIALVSLTKKGLVMTGTYKFIDESRMKVEFGGFGALAGAQVETISVKNGELSITHLDGKSQRYTKIK